MKNRSIKFLVITLALILVVTSLSACSGGSEPSPEPPQEETSAEFNPADYPIGMPAAIKTHPVIQIWIAGFVTKAKELGYPYHVYAVDGTDMAQMYNLAETGIIQHGLKGMVMHTWEEGSHAYFKKWADQGIVVVSEHQDFGTDPSAYPGLSAWAACSSVEYSKTVANEMGKVIGGKGKVVVTEGSFNPQENEAAASFKAEMNKNFPDVVVLDPQEEGFDTAVAIQRATAILQANPDVVGAYSTTGNGPTTWATAQKNAGKKICIISMDYTEPNLDLVKSGEVYALVAQPLFQEFQMAVELLDKIFRGEDYEYANMLEAPLVTSANVDDYYDLIKTVNATMKEVN